MINWFDMPAEGLSNGGLFEVKELEVTENGTYETKGEMYNKVTVNVEGGGGSSDFSMAEVTIVNNSQTEAFNFIMAITMTNGGISATTGYVPATPTGETEVFNVTLHKGNAHVMFETTEDSLVITTTGNISDLGGDNYMVTGDCTITIS